MDRISINVHAVALYLFGMSIIYLAAFSMGKGLLFIYYVALFFPFFSLIQLLVSFLSFRYHQYFSTEHPLKGEEIVYKLSLSNESFLSNMFVKVSFRAIEFSDTEKMPDLYLRFKRFELIKKKFAVHCPYRGIYTVGLDYIMLRDVLGWCKIYLKVWFRTFYVYPRVIDLPGLFISEQNFKDTSGTQQGRTDDATLFRTLTEYRSGTAIRHMAWKKFAALGQPFLKIYDKSSLPGVRIYLDLRRTEPLSAQVLEKEDCSIEIMVALVHFFLKKQEPVMVKAIGKETHVFQGHNLSSFSRFHEDTINYFFSDTLSPVRLYNADLSGDSNAMHTVIFITHLLDPEIFEITTPGHIRNKVVYTICNQSCWNDRQISESNVYLMSVKERGGSVVIVKSSETMENDLQ